MLQCTLRRSMAPCYQMAFVWVKRTLRLHTQRGDARVKLVKASSARPAPLDGPRLPPQHFPLPHPGASRVHRREV
jgi:hypothetical protein